MNKTTRVCAFLGALSYITAPAAFAAEKVYAVVFDVALDADGKVDTLTVNRVIDPASGTIDPVQVRVPASSMSAARAFLGKRTYPRMQQRFHTYTFFAPAAA